MNILGNALGSSFDDPKTHGILALAANMIRGDFGGGLAAAGETFAQAKEKALREKYMNMQMQNMESEIAQRKAATAKSGEGLGLLRSVMQGASYAPGQLGSGSLGVVDSPNPYAPPQARGLAAASPDQIGLLKAYGYDLMEPWKVAKEGFEEKPGTFRRDAGTGQSRYIADPTKGVDFRNGTVSALPGFAETNATIKGAETAATEGAKNNFQLLPLDYTNSDGSPIGGSVGAYLNRNQPMRNMSGGNISPELAEFIRTDAQRNGIANPQANFKGASPSGTYTLSNAPVSAPLALRSKESAEAASAAAKLPFQTAEKVNDTWLKSSYEPAIVSGNAAGDTLTNVQVARQSMRNMGGTGWTTETAGVAAGVLSGLGIAPANAKVFAANVETFQNAAMSNLQTKLDAAKGPQTEGDANRASKLFAQLKNTPRANEFILDMLEAKATRDKMKSDFFQQALPIARQRGDLQEVDREWSKRQPSVFNMPSMQKWAGGIK